MANGQVGVSRSDFEVIEHEGHLFIWRCEKQVGTICIAWIIARITWRIKLALFTRGTTVCE